MKPPSKLQELLLKKAQETAAKVAASPTSSVETIKTATIVSSRLEALKAKLRAEKEIPPSPQSFELTELQEKTPAPSVEKKLSEEMRKLGTVESHSPESRSADLTKGGWNKYGEWIDYNPEQSMAVQIAGVEGKSCCIIGSAGTGKTSVMNGVAKVLINSGRIPLEADFGDHKFLPSGKPGIVFCAFTHVATNNLRANLPPELAENCMTIHKLIEFQPVPYSVTDENGETRSVLRFEETRHAMRPLPEDLKVIVFEESSMIDVELYNKVRRALPHSVQFIMLGDIQQLTPVFGSAVLGFKLTEYPLIALTQVYRQAADSPIIKLAYRILEGKPLPLKELETFNGNGLGIFPAKHAISDPDLAEEHLGRFYCQALDAGLYNPEEDMILIPFNKAPGIIGVNKYIANHLARKRGAIVFEVFAGFEAKYFAVGDKIFAERKEGKIISIKKNGFYFGKQTQPESQYLDYWGINHAPAAPGENKPANAFGDMDSLQALAAMEDAEMFAALDAALEESDGKKRKKTASHVIEVRFKDGTERTYTSAGEINDMMHSYALTVHKSQGSEWRTVFLAFHRKHNIALCRELLYTAVTRAREKLHILCEKDTFIKGILTQEIPGNDIKTKIQHFVEKTANGSTLPIAG